MDILEETDVFLSACQLTQDESNNLVFNGITGCFESKYLADWFVNQINFGWKLWQAAKARAVPEGFVLVLKEPNEEMIISGLAVVATGIGKHNIDEEIRKIWQKMIEAQESANEL